MKTVMTNRWSRATRWPFLTGSIVPVFAGTGYAWWKDRLFSPSRFLLAAAGLCCLHLAANLLNDYFDHRTGNDEANRNFSPFNGGSRVIQDGVLAPAGVLRLGLAFLAAGFAAGAVFTFWTRSPVIPVLGAVGLISIVGYTAKPLAVGYRGFGELLVGLNFGPLSVLGAAFVQTGRVDWATLWAGIPVGCLIAAVLLVNEIPDMEADASVSKRTWVVRYGANASVRIYVFLLGTAFMTVLAGVLTRGIPLACLLILPSLVPAFRAVSTLTGILKGGPHSIRANAWTIQLHLMFGLLLCAGLVAGSRC
jgi:1,4-dihydroxy-2-naphthoate polyprenyltransferase